MRFRHPVELLNTLLPSGLPPHQLVLKVGAPVVFIRNLNREQGIMNGTRGVIQSCSMPNIFLGHGLFLKEIYLALPLPEVPAAGFVDDGAEGGDLRRRAPHQPHHHRCLGRGGLALHQAAVPCPPGVLHVRAIAWFFYAKHWHSNDHQQGARPDVQACRAVAADPGLQPRPVVRGPVARG